MGATLLDYFIRCTMVVGAEVEGRADSESHAGGARLDAFCISIGIVIYNIVLLGTFVGTHGFYLWNK